jgi:predicted ATPase
MYALFHTSQAQIFSGDHILASEADELIELAEEKRILFWNALGMLCQGCVLALSGKASNAVQILTSGLTARWSTGSTVFEPFYLSCLARAHADLAKFSDAWRCIDEAIAAMEASMESWCKANVHRTAGELALVSPEPDPGKAEMHFERSLCVAREQQARSWELRTATSMARLWRDQGKREQARDLLAPIYGWFTRRLRYA